MKKLLFLLFFIFISTIINAQTSVNDYIVSNDSIYQRNQKQPKKVAVKTKYIFKDKKGNTYPVYKGTKGGFYIIRTSKRSGKQYRKYIKLTI